MLGPFPSSFQAPSIYKNYFYLLDFKCNGIDSRLPSLAQQSWTSSATSRNIFSFCTQPRSFFFYSLVLWCLCSVSVVSLQFLCSVSVVSLQCLCGVSVVSLQCICSISLVSCQCHSSVSLVSLLCLFSVTLVSLQCLFSVSLVSLQCVSLESSAV